MSEIDTKIEAAKWMLLNVNRDLTSLIFFLPPESVFSHLILKFFPILFELQFIELSFK